LDGKLILADQPGSLGLLLLLILGSPGSLGTQWGNFLGFLLEKALDTVHPLG